MNTANSIRARLRCGDSPRKLAHAVTSNNGATMFWTVANFHNIERGVALGIVEKHTSTTGTDWRAAVNELEFLIVPF